MNTQIDIELRLRNSLEAIADRSVADGQVAAVVARTAGFRQRPAWLVSLRSPSMTDITLVRPAAPRALGLVGILALLAVALVAAYLVIGNKPKDTLVNGQIVFGRFDESLGDTVVYVVNPDGSNVRKLRPETFQGPFWSPDGSQIGLGHSVINADGSNYRTWDQSGNAFNVECWDWSPDGARMLCEGFADELADDGDIHGVYTVRASDGLDLVRLSTPGVLAIPMAYSPDGTRVLWTQSCVEESRCELIVANVDGSNQRRVGNLLFHIATWAPDGRAALASASGKLYSVDIATGVATPVLVKGVPAQIWKGQWSPDGTRILIHRYMGSLNTDLYTMMPDGTDVIHVTNNPDEDSFSDWGTHPIEQ